MAEQDSSILRVEENGVEFFTVAKTGDSGLSQSGLARASGVTQQALSKLTKLLTTKSPAKRLERFIGKNLTLTTNFSCADRKARRLTIYKADFCAAVIQYYAYLGNETAQDTLDAIAEIGLTSFIQSKTGWLPSQYKAAPQSHNKINRILDTPSPWKKMYEPEFCKKAFSMFGSNFYWQFCYSWMTQEEQCKVNRVNPVVNGKRDARIHQFLDADIRKRLTPYVAEMVVLIDIATSRQEFNDLYARRYGANQLNLL